MTRPLTIALIALLAATPLSARKRLPAPEIPVTPQGLVDNVNGYTIDGQGNLARFSGLLIGRDGRVVKLLHEGDARPERPDFRLDGQHRTLLPGLNDAHGHISGLGFQALGLDLTTTTSLADAQRRLERYAAEHETPAWIRGGARRVTARPFIVPSLSTPDATMNDSSHPSSR
jgi:predicted amidohydrolase YtcJ